MFSIASRGIFWSISAQMQQIKYGLLLQDIFSELCYFIDNVGLDFIGFVVALTRRGSG